MRCKTCNYRLWNLTSRQCPECGTAFRPSEHAFLPNSVQFKCPHCEQPYYGTGAKGHLIPPAFACVGCGRDVDMDEMVLLPTAGLEEEQTQVEHSPWLERKQIGFFKGWFKTVGASMVGQTKLMRATPVNSSIAEAWGFGLLSLFVVALLSMSLFIALPIAFGVAGAMGGSRFGQAALGLATFFGFMILAPFALSAIVISVWGLMVHGVLRLTGETVSGLSRTYHSMCYSSASMAPAALPCFGFYLIPVGLVWWAVSAVVMIREGQGVSVRRAVFSVVTPAVLGAAGLVGLFSYFVVYSSNSLVTQVTIQASRAEVQVMTSWISLYAGDHEGRGPAHAIELVTDGPLTESQLIGSGSATNVKDVVVGEMTLEEFMTASDEEREAAAQACADGLPADTIAHRLGDYVFTYHGMDLDEVDGQLWMVVQWPDPEAAAANSSGWVCVGLVNGQVQPIPTQAFDALLKTQNDLRAGEDLAPLPSPGDVTHDQPAVQQSEAEASGS